MKILLDTHIYFWVLEDNSKLTQKAKNIIVNAEMVYVSIVSLIEAAIKIQRGRLALNMEKLIHEITACGFLELPLQFNHTKMLSTLQRHHKDPFDHMLISQAMSEPLQFLTADKSLKSYS